MRIVPKVKGVVTILLLAVVAGLAMATLGIRLIENRLVYFPPRYPQGFPAAQTYAGDADEVWLTTQDGVRINAFYHSNPASQRALLWFHGNAENIGYGLEHLRALATLGVNILAVDYRGYGKSEGSPTEAGVYRDADAAYDYLRQQRQIRPENIIVYGHSLGGAVAINLASRRPCGGLIVQSSFTSARAMARLMLSLPLFEYVVKSRFDSLERVRDVHAPVLIVHGTRDEVIPYVMGEQLFRAAPQPKQFYRVEGAGHNNLMEVGGEAYLACLRHFVAECATRAAGPPAGR
jgi:hypothetical protein